MIKIEVFGSKKREMTTVISQIIREAAKVFKKDNFQVDVCLINNREMLKLNRRFRGRNKLTSILSFPSSTKFLYPKNFLPYQGEIFLNLSFIKKEAKSNKIPLQQNMAILLIHGLLHLFGFNHKNKKETLKMEAREEKILSSRTLLSFLSKFGVK